MIGATGPFNVVTRWPATSRNITFQHWRGPAAQLLLSIVCRSGIFLISFDGCWRPWIVNLDCPAQTRQTNCVRSRGAPRQPPRTQPRSPHHDRSGGPWGGGRGTQKHKRRTRNVTRLPRHHASGRRRPGEVLSAICTVAVDTLALSGRHWQASLSAPRPFLDPEATCGKAGLHRRREGLELTDVHWRADLKMTDCELGRAMVNRSRGRRARQAECR